MSVRDYLIEDIKHLSEHNVNKLYKYVRRYLVASIDGLVDPLETPSNNKYTTPQAATKSCPHCGSTNVWIEIAGKYNLCGDCKVEWA